MKLNKILLVSILLLVIISMSTVCAQDNLTSDMGDNEDLNALSEVSEIAKTTLINEDKLITSNEDAVDEINMSVDVSNVYEGCETTIYVTAPNVTGTVNITVGEKSYISEFIDGEATKTISEYSIGLNNVTVKYNDVVKETSFKVLDGVVTNETFNDYFEVVGFDYELVSCIPKGATLDFRGNVFIEYIPGKAQDLIIDAPINLISSTKDAVIDYRRSINILNTAIESNISNIKFGSSLNIRAPNCNIINSNIGGLGVESNLSVINCTIDANLRVSDRALDNVRLVNSTFNNGIYMRGQYIWMDPVSNISIVNCIIAGETFFYKAKHVLIDNCTFNDGFIIFMGGDENITFKNNFVNVTSSTYAINIDVGQDCRDFKFINNVIYSKNYCGNNAIDYPGIRDVDPWPETRKIFENNTPTQTDLNVGFTSDTIFYDENTTVIVNMPGIEGNVVFYFNNQKLSDVKLVDGIATLTIDKCELGINNITVVYEDIVNDIYGINHTSFNVNKVNCSIKILYDSVVEEKASVVNVILPDDANGTIFLRLYNDTYSILIKHDANGKSNLINVPPLLEGNYIVSAVFTSIKYVTNITNGTITFVHVPVYNLIDNAVTMDYKDESKYKVLVTKDGKSVGSGEIVKITFNGKTTVIKTDKDGYAILTLDAAPKTYTINAVYKGVSKSNRVTIKNILKASNVSKKKAKSIKFSVTLKTTKGKAIVGKKITFKVKGKTYFAKTNKKGVATVSIKNLKVGKYTITSKYGACTVKNTIKIKK